MSQPEKRVPAEAETARADLPPTDSEIRSTAADAVTELYAREELAERRERTERAIREASADN